MFALSRSWRDSGTKNHNKDPIPSQAYSSMLPNRPFVEDHLANGQLYRQS